MSSAILHYRPWKGDFRPALWSVWPIARCGLAMIFRRKLFWAVYALGLLIFLMFFFGQYLLDWARSQAGDQSVSILMVRTRPSQLIELLRERLKLNGTGETYRNFFWYQGYMVMVVLAMAGSILVGNDFHFGSLPFYLAKPLGPWHYLLGKCLAVGVFVNLMTTVPALVLYFQFGSLTSWLYYYEEYRLFFGILGYGALLTVTLSLMLVASACWLRRTMPLIMVWSTAFVFFRLLSAVLVDGLRYHERFRLIDLWNNAYLVGNYFLGVPHANVTPQPQPATGEAALVLGAVCLTCLTYLSLRIRAVEIVK